MPTFHSRGALLMAGWTDDEIRTRLRNSSWQRLAAGRYLMTTTEELTPEAAHALLTRAELSRFSSPEVMAGHASAAALHRLPLVGTTLRRVEVIRHGASGSRVTRTCRVRASRVPAEDRTVVDGTPVTGVARTLVDLARSGPLVTAVAATDHALQHDLVSADAVVAALRRIRSGPRLPRARRVLELADGRAESPYESATRLALRDGGIADVDLQLSIHDERGRFVGRVDGALEELGVAIEYDGRGKYTAVPGPEESAAHAVLREKRREDRLRELGWAVVRFDRSDLADPHGMVRRVRAAARRRRGVGPPAGSTRHAEPRTIRFPR